MKLCKRQFLQAFRREASQITNRHIAWPTSNIKKAFAYCWFYMSAFITPATYSKQNKVSISRTLVPNQRGWEIMHNERSPANFSWCSQPIDEWLRPQPEPIPLTLWLGGWMMSTQSRGTWDHCKPFHRTHEHIGRHHHSSSNRQQLNKTSSRSRLLQHEVTHLTW